MTRYAIRLYYADRHILYLLALPEDCLQAVSLRPAGAAALLFALSLPYRGLCVVVAGQAFCNAIACYPQLVYEFVVNCREFCLDGYCGQWRPLKASLRLRAIS